MKVLRTRRGLLRSLAAIGATIAFGPARAEGTRRLAIFHWEDREQFSRSKPTFFAILAERGWREGRNLTVDWFDVRMDSPDLERLAAQVVAERPDAIFTESTSGTRALSKATRTIPIVTSVGDPVRSGFAASLARPGGNISGLCNIAVGAEAKALELLRAAVPRLASLVVFFQESSASWREFAQPFLDAAAQGGIAARLVLIPSGAGAEPAVREAARSGAHAAVVGGFLDDELVRAVGEAARRHRLPTVTLLDQFRHACLITFQLYHANEDRSLALVVDKVLRGMRPADIAFEQPESSRIIINQTLATALGIKIPPELLLRATHVI